MSIQALRVGYTGLIAAKSGIDTASNNIANANTEGYTRQRVALATNLPISLTYGELGTGVHVEDVARTRDAFLDDRVRASSSSLQALETRTELLNRAESILGEPDRGLSVHLDDLWESFEELSLDSTDLGSRLAVTHSLESITARIRQISEGVDSLTTSARNDLSTTIVEANALINQIGGLNDAIGQASLTGTPNSLMDQRDLAVDRLAELTGAAASITDQGTFIVTLNGLSLVVGISTNELVYDSSTDSITHSRSGLALSPGGNIGGQQQFIVEDSVAIKASLNQFATELTTVLNTQHQAGFSDTGLAGGDLLDFTAIDPAGTIDVVLPGPADLAASDTDGNPFPAFNGENAMRLSELRRSLSAMGGTQAIGSLARSFVSDVGSRVVAARDGAAAQRDLATAASLSREGTHGVSIDEEMIDLIRFQRAFAAAARVITAADEALQTVINRTGIVGR